MICLSDDGYNEVVMLSSRKYQICNLKFKQSKKQRYGDAISFGISSSLSIHQGARFTWAHYYHPIIFLASIFIQINPSRLNFALVTTALL